MSISSALLSAKSGLTAVSTRADLVAQNIANASTPGYVRRSLTVSETIVGGNTAGVQVISVDRALDTNLTNERRRLGSDMAQSDILSETWASLSRRIGDDPQSSTLFQHISALDNAFKNAAQSPESTTHANEIIRAANNLTGEFNSLSTLISTERLRADQDIAATIDNLNAMLKQVEELNGAIAKVDRTTSQAASLLDERGRVLDKISEYLPIQTFPREGGSIDVLTTEGVYLVAGQAKTVEFTPANTIGPNISLAGGTLSGLTVDGLDITPGATTFGAVSSGSLAALFTLRDTDLPALSTQLDAMAQDLIDRFSDPSIDATNPAGSPGFLLDTNAAAGAGVAGRIELNALVDPSRGGDAWRIRDGLGAAVEGPPGNTTILTNLSTAFETVQNVSVAGLQGGFTASDLIAQLGTLAGQQRVQNESTLSSISIQFDAVQRAEAAETAVDIETELQALLLIEQAYAANARVIEAASQMVNQLIEIT
ncbi:MAG: flagellar hook-associated protein FlgK [Pseudomonadota bacterium]